MRFEKLLLAFMVGALSGMMIFEGLVVLVGRHGTFGGEILILPLLFLLFYFGWDIGRSYTYEKAYKRGIANGYVQGYEKGYSERQQEII